MVLEVGAMEDTHVIAAQRECAELKRKLEALNTRIAELETFIRVAGTLAVSAAPSGRPRLTRELVIEHGVPIPQTFKAQVIKVTEDALTETKWMKTKDIVSRLEKSGVTINTAGNKVVRISAILVKEKDKFLSNRKRGWTLKQGRIDSPKGEGPNARTLGPTRPNGA
jgi:hypothetical protein